eukprot:tig00021332_g20332.t1
MAPQIPSPEYPGMKITPDLLAKGARIIEAGCKEALAAYGTKALTEMRRACMRQDFRWATRVLLYEKVFYETLGIERGAPATPKEAPVAPVPSAAPKPADLEAAQAPQAPVPAAGPATAAPTPARESSSRAPVPPVRKAVKA